MAEIEAQTAPLLDEADQLRRGIAAIEPIEPGATATIPRAKQLGRTQGARRHAKPPGSRRARGATLEQVLAAIRTEPKTAGQIAQETGLSRGTVSTSLARLVRDAQANKATGGYQAT